MSGCCLLVKNHKSVSVHRLRGMSALGARLPFTAPVCFQFVGRSEHTCGPKAQQSVDSSRMGDIKGSLRCDCANIVTVQIQEYVVSGQAVKDCLRPDDLLIQV